MNITEKKLENSTVELSIVVPSDRVESAYKGAFEKIQRSARIDGFRKGKVPMPLVERNYAGLADEQAAEDLINGSIYDAIRSKELKPISQPQYNFESIERGKEFSYRATFEVMPSADLSEYKGLDAEEMSCTVTDEDVESEILNMREQHAEVTPVEDENAVLEEGNLARALVKRIDDVAEGDRDSVNFREYPLVIGKSSDDFGLDKRIGGMKKGEEREIEIEYPSDYRVAEFAGNKITYLVRIAGISTMALPPLDDEFAKKMNSETVQDLRDKTREMMIKYVAERAKAEVRNNLIDRVTGASTFDIPLSMIRQEMRSVLAKRMQAMGFPTENIQQFQDQILDSQDEGSADFRQSLRDDAEKTIKNTIVLTEIAKKEGIKVDEERVQEVFRRISDKVGDSVENVEKKVMDNDLRDDIENELLLDIAMDYIYSNAKVRKLDPVPYQNFMAALR